MNNYLYDEYMSTWVGHRVLRIRRRTTITGRKARYRVEVMSLDRDNECTGNPMPFDNAMWDRDLMRNIRKFNMAVRAFAYGMLT